MNRTRMGRRTATLGMGAALAWLGTMRAARADVPRTTASPKRFVVFFTPNGTVHERWSPSGGERDFVLSPILAPLERHRSRLTVLDGLSMPSAASGPGDDHQRGMGHMLTGVSLLHGSGFDGQGAPDAGWGGGESIDQLIADRFAAETPYRSLELGVLRRGGVGGTNANVWNRMCYRGAGEPLPPVDDPRAVFDRVFGSGEGPEIERRRRTRPSVLDVVRGDLASLRTRAGASDRLRLDAHASAIREIELRLETGPMCTAAAPPDLDAGSYAHMPEVGRAQMDLLALALGCGQTRVASLQWTESVGTATFPWLGLSDADVHHHLSHFEPTPDLRARFAGESDTDFGVYIRAVQGEKLGRIGAWFAEQLAYLVDRLEALPEGDGTVMDNTCILWINELGDGQGHTHTNVPAVLVGDAGGVLAPGRCLRLGGRSSNDLLLTLARCFGVDASTFGDPAHCTGPIAELIG